MIRIGDKTKKAILSVHILFAAAWLGTTICSLIVLLFQADRSSTDEQLSFVHNILKLFYLGLLIPSAIGSIKTGLLLSIFTHWGLTKYYWVIVKWIVSASLIAWLTLFVGKWVMIGASPDLFNKNMTAIGLSVQILLLLLLIVVSLFKPWGKRARTN